MKRVWQLLVKVWCCMPKCAWQVWGGLELDSTVGLMVDVLVGSRRSVKRGR